MTVQQTQEKETALGYARTASAAFADVAALFRDLPNDAWGGPTGCEKWTMHELAGHIAGEAVWFAHLVLETTEGVSPLPDSTWGELNALPGKEIAERVANAARELTVNVESAPPRGLEGDANLGWATMPLWEGLAIGMQEGVIHNWDVRVGRDPNATIPTPWAQALAPTMVNLAPFLARRDAAQAEPGTYLLDVGDGIGPVTIIAGENGVTAEQGKAGPADVTLRLSADQYVRLIAGRLPLKEAIANGSVTVEGDASRAEGLNRIFKGINNG